MSAGEKNDLDIGLFPSCGLLLIAIITRSI